MTYRELDLKHERIEMDRRQVKEKWSGDTGANLTYPESNSDLLIDEDVVTTLHSLTYGGLVCEVGCGTGRIAQYLKKDKYIGVDINHTALAVAKGRCPGYSFKYIKWNNPYPKADVYLLFATLFHIPDSEVNGIIERLSNRVVVVESMMPWFRQYGRGNNFQRSPDEYECLFMDHGFKCRKLVHVSVTPFPYFINFMVFEK